MMMAKTKKAADKAVEEHRSAWRFVPPWIGAVLLPVAGQYLHNVWGVSTSRVVVAVAPLGITAATAVVAAATLVTALQARKRSDRSRYILAGHSVGTVALVGVAVIATEIVGWWGSPVWRAVYMLSAVTLVLTWNVRRFDIFHVDQHAAEHKDGVLGELGLSLKGKPKVVTDTKDLKEVALKLADGQTVEDVQKMLPAIGSHVGTIRKGTRAVPGEREGEVLLSMSMKDVLKDTIVYPGPTHPGGSIADGVHLGLYEDGQEVWLYPAGNYEKNIAPGHLAIAGLSRTGKGVLARVIITELSTRRDVIITGSDTRKGEQFLGPIRGAVDWWVSTEPEVKQQLKAIERAMDARNKALGKAGYDSWTPKAFDDPRLRMPALVHWMEEAAAVLDDNPRIITELGEAALSAGIILVFSAQRWSNDRIPTSLRYNVANAVCYGVGDDVSATMVLSDSTLKAGPDPYEWRGRFPGRALLEGNGIDTARFPVPWKTFFIDRGPAAAVISEWQPVRPQHDGVTLAAFGEAYTKLATSANVPAVVGDDDEDDEDFADFGEEEEKYMIPPQPDPEMAAQVNPRDEIPPYEGEDIDLNPEPQPGERKLTPEERRVAFAEMIGALMDAHREEVTMGELVEAWDEKVGPSQANQRPFLHEQINVWIEHGQIERVQEGRGRYRLLAAATVGAH